MSSSQSQGQDLDSNAGTLAVSNRNSTYSNKSGDVFSDEGDLSSGASYHTANSTSKDLEFGKLPTVNPNVQNGTKNKTTRQGDSNTLMKRMRRSKYYDFCMVSIYSFGLCTAIMLPIALVPVHKNDIRLAVSVAMKNIEVVNGTFKDGNGTTTPVSDFNLFGSNLTVATCNYIDANELCTNNTFHHISILWPCSILFLILLYKFIWDIVGTRYGLVKIRARRRDANQ
ncbi:uncharacterized protein EAF01_004667 [Botrytis porri]|uniref:Uncharacterized protein n=1 Tax=Botrytis porri TaxID=87229 RepID=A0A4Z1KVF3_9HELO|nr:uncharacterized protein EAF01_004667 [Botrytis porri]KAF7907080.1 hypothetical protein EAF01_004667 [Botrytis porri]TGO88508.1 hypothetical protein BPOR_0158g00080 [Botrytis porri]